MGKLLITVEEASEMTSLSETQLYTMARRGELDCVVRVGRAVRFHEPKLRTWAERMAEQNAAEVRV